MRKNIIITGLPELGKSTLLEKTIPLFTQAFGIITSEVCEEGKRMGFKMSVVSPDEAVHSALIAHKDFIGYCL